MMDSDEISPLGSEDTQFTCGCDIVGDGSMHSPLEIVFCPMHKAAPELLAALENLLRESAGPFFRLADTVHDPACKNAAVAAIAKAKGEAT